MTITRTYIAGKLTAAVLRAAVSYDVQTGIFSWRHGQTGHRPGGKQAGGLSSEGYWRICIDGERHQAHRLAWLYVYGEWPTKEIDHFDTNKLNNRMQNLRQASGSINCQNKRKARADNKSGLLGVSREGRGWRAVIHVGGVQKHLGHYFSPEQAHARYVEAKRELHAGNTL